MLCLDTVILPTHLKPWSWIWSSGKDQSLKVASAAIWIQVISFMLDLGISQRGLGSGFLGTFSQLPSFEVTAGFLRTTSQRLDKWTDHE